MPRVRRCRQYGCHKMVEFPNHYCKKHFEHEAEYLAKRQKWARSHEQSYIHKYNTISRNRNANKSRQYQFYRTKQWVALRRQVLERDNYLCQYCKVQGKFTPNSRTVDHIVPIEVDSTIQASISNLTTTCPTCHRMKTDWEQSYYGTGQENTLKSVEPITDIQAIVILMLNENSKSREKPL